MIENKPLEVKTKLPKDSVTYFAHWMKANSYALNSIQNYHLQIKRLIKKNDYISPEMIKAFLSVKNTIIKRSAIKLFLTYLDDVHNITLESFRYPRLKKQTKAPDVINRDSFNRINKELPTQFSFFAKVMYFTAMRLSEVIKVRVEWFNWVEWVMNKDEQGILKILNAKRNKDRIIPVQPKLMQEIYLYAPKHPDGALKKGLLFNFNFEKYIRRKRLRGFPLEVAESRYVKKVSRRFQIELSKAAKKALGRSLKTHTLRSSRASHLDQKGIPPTVIRDILGHESLSTTNRYIINTPERIKESLNKIDDY